MFEKRGLFEKNSIIKNRFIFNFTMASENFIQISSLGTDIQNFGEVRIILYNINLFEKYDQYKKKLFSKTVIFFYFMFGYQILWNSICWGKI